jgi:putative tricarboxylic transport membrane protein
MRHDTVIGGVLLAFAAAYGYLTLQLPAQRVPHTLGPAFLPKFLIGLLTLLAVLLMVQGRRSAPADDRPFPAGALSRTGLLMAWMVAYTVGMGHLGYLLTTPVFLLGMIWLAGERRPLRVILWTVVLFAGIHLLLRVLFSVPLPLGPFD